MVSTRGAYGERRQHGTRLLHSRVWASQIPVHNWQIGNSSLLLTYQPGLVLHTCENMHARSAVRALLRGTREQWKHK